MQVYVLCVVCIISELTSWSWALLEKPPIVQLLKNFPIFYEIQKFITVFTRTLHWSLSWARLIQSIPPHPVSLRYILTLSTHLRFTSLSYLYGTHSPFFTLFTFRGNDDRGPCMWLSQLLHLKIRKLLIYHSSDFLGINITNNLKWRSHIYSLCV
jgi:hypothetical protein